MDEPVGEYRNHTYQGVFVVSQPLYTGGALNAQHQIAKADEKLNQLNEELTLDRFTIKVMLSTGMLRFKSHATSSRQIPEHCQTAI